MIMIIICHMNKEIASLQNVSAASSLRQEDHAALPVRMTSTELFGAAREVVIEHAGSEYRLRVTSNDKLILTK
jgi:hemin uptake protein HemP